MNTQTTAIEVTTQDIIATVQLPRSIARRCAFEGCSQHSVVNGRCKEHEMLARWLNHPSLVAPMLRRHAR